MFDREPFVPLNDLDLIDEIRAGSRAAFEQLIRRHEHHVYRVAYAYVGDADSAMDVVQNVFIKTHRKLDAFEGRSTFRTWLTRIAQNEGLNWLQEKKRQGTQDELTPANTPDAQPMQELSLIESERSRDLLAEVHRLNPRQRRAVLLRYFEKMPVREIGEVLECSEGQVKNILFRSLQKLRQRLPRQGRWDRELEA